MAQGVGVFTNLPASYRRTYVERETEDQELITSEVSELAKSQMLLCGYGLWSDDLSSGGRNREPSTHMATTKTPHTNGVCDGRRHLS
jgi:hypothetical protein